MKLIAIFALFCVGVAQAQTPLSGRLTPSPDINALIQAALEADAAPVTAFPVTPYPGQCKTRSDLDNERFCWDAGSSRWLGELRTTMFSYKDGADGVVLWFGATEGGQTEFDLGPSFNDDVLLADVAISWDGPISTAKTVDVRSNTTVLATVSIVSGSNRTDQALSVVLPSDTYLNIFVSSAGNNLIDPWVHVSFRRIAL